MKKTSKTIILAFPIGDSAVTEYFMALSEELARRGYSLVLITPGKDKHQEIVSSNQVVYTWPSPRPTHWQDAIFLAKIIQRHNPVMILANFGAVNISLLVSWLMRVPLRYAMYHTADNKYIKEYGLNPYILLYQKIRKAFVYKFATMVFPVAEAMVLEVEKYGVSQKKIRCFHNALKDPNLSISRKINSRKLLCVGRLSFGKGQDVLINAMHRVVKKYPEVKLYLLGTGESGQELAKQTHELNLTDSVFFLGRIPHDQVLLEMSEAYIVIVPSRFDAMPYVVIEAISLGVPVIASNIGGIPEIIRDRVDGYLVSPDDSEALAEKIIELLHKNETRRMMSVNARERFLEKFELRQAILKQADWLDEQIHQTAQNLL